VVLDNLGAHRNDHARTVVEVAGCRLQFLPACLPDVNPIGPAFAKVKPAPRRAAARTADDLLAASAGVIDAVTAADARALSAHRGFPQR
jgi:transposase